MVKKLKNHNIPLRSTLGDSLSLQLGDRSASPPRPVNVASETTLGPVKAIKIYSTPTCHYCHLVKSFFDENDIAFEDVDVSQDQKASQEMVEKSGQMGVPVIMIDDELVIGFDKEKIKRLIA